MITFNIYLLLSKMKIIFSVFNQVKTKSNMISGGGRGKDNSCMASVVAFCVTVVILLIILLIHLNCMEKCDNTKTKCKIERIDIPKYDLPFIYDIQNMPTETIFIVSHDYLEETLLIND